MRLDEVLLIVGDAAKVMHMEQCMYDCFTNVSPMFKVCTVPIDMYTIMVMMNVLTVVHGVGGDRGEPHGTDNELC